MKGLEIAQAKMKVQKVAFSAKVRCPSEDKMQRNVGLRFSIEDMIMGKGAGAALVLSGGQVIATCVFQRICVGGDDDVCGWLGKPEDEPFWLGKVKHVSLKLVGQSVTGLKGFSYNAPRLTSVTREKARERELY